jgi:phosphoenolpyruvate carboxykinase (ATP)
MSLMATPPRGYGLEYQGIHNPGKVHWTPNTPSLYEHVIQRREGHIAHLGPLVVYTGQHTGRSPKDKFIVKEPTTEEDVAWGPINQPIAENTFDNIYRRLLGYLQSRELFVQDCFVGADPEYRMAVRVITESAWQSLFARNLFIQATRAELENFVPEFTVIQAPFFQTVPALDGTRSETFIGMHFGRKLVIICGTQYAGESKKAVFSALNYLLPFRNVLPMHCSANYGAEGDVALFFGLSGTGKTTLSTDPERILIGDDEHGWSDNGVFNMEGGCYAKTINLSPKAEPEIYEATRRFGTVLENVGFDPKTGRVDLDDESITENTRAAYPITHIARATRSGLGGHPTNILMLAADAFGVMPPIAKLTPAQALYHFLSGYTAKVAGTEKGVTEPEATFSACFGEPFMVLPPIAYAKLLGERIAKHNVDVWLVNTGWSGGPYGVGKRMEISYTRAMVRAALSGALRQVPTRHDELFNLEVPISCPDVPNEALDPKRTWSDPTKYDQYAAKLAEMFRANFSRFVDEVPAEVAAAGPQVMRSHS